MLQAFIITLREGVEAALIVGITLAYLAKIGRPELRKSVYAALAAAFLGSIGAAVVISRLKINQDIFEGWVMLLAAFFVITMIIFMMRTGRKLKGHIEGKVGAAGGRRLLDRPVRLCVSDGVSRRRGDRSYPFRRFAELYRTDELSWARCWACWRRSRSA